MECEMKQKLFIQTLNWNGKGLLERLYKTLIPAVEMFDFKWLVKDNGSKDGSIEFLKSIENDRVDVLYCGHNTDSFSSGMNILFERAKPADDDLILLLNNDVWFGDKTSVVEMNKLLTEDVGEVGARILLPDSNKLQHAGVYFSKRYNYFPYHYKHHEPSDAETEKNRELQAVTAALALLRAGDYRRVCTYNKSGRVGFDEKYFFSFEDIDLSLSIKYNLGKRIIYCGKTNVYHEESSTLKKNPMHKLMMSTNCTLFRKKWEGVYKHDD
jgi:GT2 family glycosyltransferase